MTLGRRYPTVVHFVVVARHRLAPRSSAAPAPHAGERLLERSVPRARVEENLRDTPIHRRLGLVLVTRARLVSRLGHRVGGHDGRALLVRLDWNIRSNLGVTPRGKAGSNPWQASFLVAYSRRNNTTSSSNSGSGELRP